MQDDARPSNRGDAGARRLGPVEPAGHISLHEKYLGRMLETG